MWVLEVLETGKQSVIRGPIVKFGRSPDNDFSFSTDKSISRNHAELHVSKDTMPAPERHNSSGINDVLEVVDKTSSFGSFLDGIKMEAKKRYRVQSGCVITLGGSTPPTRVKVTYVQLRICTSRLDKQESKTIKACMQQLGGQKVNDAENATHLVTTSYAATIKTLTALALPSVKIVRPEWLQAMCTDPAKAAVLLPPEEVIRL
jgi:pSer/pThr/pTyr-binding forkhead associated (FHA) protein